MGQLLYFVENAEAWSGHDLQRCGLEHAFDGGCATRKASDGPGGQPGLVLGASSEHLGFWRDRQTWVKLRDKPQVVWVGWSSSAPPGPDDLLRKDAITGHDVRLADGNPWRVPIAFRVTEGRPTRAVPGRMRLDDSGRWVAGDVLPRYRRLWEIGCRWFDEYVGASGDAGSKGLTVAEAADLCAEVLAVNYRLSRLEVGALGLLDDGGTIGEILNAVVDWPTYQAWVTSQKKMEDSPAAAAG